MKKKFTFLTLTVGLTLLSSIPAFAGQWQQSSGKWWYQEDDGTYPVSQWKWIEGENHLLKCYYFDEDGWLLTNTKIDDNEVNADGAWVKDGVIQTHQGTDPNAKPMSEQDLMEYESTVEMLTGDALEDWERSWNPNYDKEMEELKKGCYGGPNYDYTDYGDIGIH